MRHQESKAVKTNFIDRFDTYVHLFQDG